ncbi:MAG: hypothetical protein HY680_08750 [Chloroflexi bacterium]|nr:hypothetical protein [Chloroflexota bacterium]
MATAVAPLKSIEAPPYPDLALDLYTHPTDGWQIYYPYGWIVEEWFKSTPFPDVDFHPLGRDNPSILVHKAVGVVAKWGNLDSWSAVRRASSANTDSTMVSSFGRAVVHDVPAVEEYTSSKDYTEVKLIFVGGPDGFILSGSVKGADRTPQDIEYIRQTLYTFTFQR